ncbi:AAA family ATPase [Desulfobacula sp.]|uniref:AAA family ATPase n=1 Tax=Desulfobacula sp. TaxID=2593537 RepID=UPI0025BC7231|nr:AAA family ATPase [Desulfobacula sp.]MBC2705445.1 AAA family ATPase [Desulfobacula sp.]
MKPFLIKLALNNIILEDEFKQAVQEFKTIEIIGELDQKKADLTVFELESESDLDRIQSYIKHTEDTEVFLLSGNSDPQVLIKAIRMGVNEFLTLPLKPEGVKESVRRFLDRQKKRKRTSETSGQIISVVGSKGGVGTTTIAVNLAVSMAQAGKELSVALLDMNILFGEIPMLLNISPKYHWGDIIKNMDRLDDFFLSNILSEHSSGVHVLPSPRYLNNQPVPPPSAMDTLLDLMTARYDYIIVDLGQSLNETALKILQRSEQIEIVTIQSLPCLSNTNRLIKSFVDFGDINKGKINVVLNRYLKKGMVTLANAQEGVGKTISWIVPNDYTTTMSAINSGKPLYQVSPRSQIVECFNDYVEKNLLPHEKKEKKKWKWF